METAEKELPFAIEIRGLVKRYGGSSGALALDGIDLDVEHGEIVGRLTS